MCLTLQMENRHPSLLSEKCKCMKQEFGFSRAAPQLQSKDLNNMITAQDTFYAQVNCMSKLLNWHNIQMYMSNAGYRDNVNSLFFLNLYLYTVISICPLHNVHSLKRTSFEEQTCNVMSHIHTQESISLIIYIEDAGS